MPYISEYTEKRVGIIQIMLYISEYTCGEGYSKCADELECSGSWEKCNGFLECNDGFDEDPDVCKGIA